MGLETVVEDIKQEAEQEAERIKEEAEEEAEEIKEEAEEEVEAEMDSKREQTLSSAKLEAKQMKLREKKYLLESFREDVEDRLAELEEGRRDLTSKLLESGIEELDEGEGLVYSAESDEDLVKDLIDDYENFEYGGKIDALGGVMVESKDGEVRINNTFDSILETLWREHMKEVSSQLFAQEG